MIPENLLTFTDMIYNEIVSLTLTMKFFANAKSEIKFALNTFGVSQIFHTRKRISSQSDFTRHKANFIEKSTDKVDAFFLARLKGFEQGRFAVGKLQPFGERLQSPWVTSIARR